MAGQRRKHHAEFKVQVVPEVLSEEKTPSEACRCYKLHINGINN